MAQDTPQDPQQDRPVSLDEFEEQRRQYYGIPKGLSVALRTQESGGKQYDKSGNVLTSPKNAKGRYQVLPDTAARYGLNADDPFENTEAAFRYMADLHKKVDPSVKDPGERWASVVAGYHSGEGGLNRVNKTGNMPGTNDGLIKTDDYVANVMKRWQQHDAGDTGTPTAQPAPQPEAAPLRPVTPATRVLKPGPQKTTARGPVLPRDSNPFAINQGATGFQQQAQQANARTGQISPEVVAQADAKARFNEQPLYKRVGQFAANQFAQGGQQAQQTLQNAVGALARGTARMMNPVGASVPPVDIRSAQGKAAQEATAQRLTREEQAFPNAGIRNENKDWADTGLDIAGGVLKAVPTMAAITAAGELVGPAAGLAAAGGSTAANADWANHPVKSALETAGSVALPYIGGKAGSKAAGLIAGRLSPGVAGALTGAFHTAGAGAANAVAPIAENVYEGKPIDWQRAATEAGIGVATGLPFAGAAAREGRANANRTALNRAVQAGELAPTQGEGGTQIQRIPGANTPAYQGLVQEGQARGRAGIGAPKQAAPAEPQAAPVQSEAPAQSALPQDRLAGIRVLGEAERVPMRDRARAKSIVYNDENGVPQNVRVLLPEGMSLGDAKRVLRDARKYQAQQSAEAAPAQPEATPAPPENPRNRAISRGHEIEQQARAEADAAIQEGRHDDARAALKRRLAALQDTRANIKRDTPGAVALRAQLGEQIFRTQEELRGLKTPAQRPVRPAPEMRPPGNEPTRDLTTPFPQAARVEPTTPFAQAEAPARKTADLPAREQVQPQAQETAQAPVVPATPTPAAQRPATSANARRRYGRGMDEAVTVHFENQADALRFDASKRGRHAAIGPEADQVAREFGIDRREAAGAIYDWRRTVEAAAKSAKPGTDVPGPSFAEFVRARQQSAAQVPEARTPQPPTGPLTEPTNRLQGAEYAGGELPRTAGLRPEGQPVEMPSRAVDPIDVAPEAKPYEVSDQMARRRQEREAALKGPFGKFAEQARKFVGREHTLASHPEMRQLLDLPEMPDYKRDQKGWTEATHDTMNALAELADQPRSSHIDEDMIKGAWARLERRAEERKAPISDDLRETMADTWERHLTAQDNYQNFIVDGRIDNILRRLDQQHEQPISRREAAELKASLVSTAGEYGLSNNYAENLWKTAQADAASRAKRGGSRAAQEAVYGSGESARAENVRAEGRAERATGTYGRERDTGRGVSAEVPAPESAPLSDYKRFEDANKKAIDTLRSVKPEEAATPAGQRRVDALISRLRKSADQMGVDQKHVDAVVTEAQNAQMEAARAADAEARPSEAMPARAREPWQMTAREVAAYNEKKQRIPEDMSLLGEPLSDGTRLYRDPSNYTVVAKASDGRQYIVGQGNEWAPKAREIAALKEQGFDTRYQSRLGQSKDHQNAIKQALAEGKPVPPEVLADYPDLQAKSAPPVAEMRPRAESEAKAAPIATEGEGTRKETYYNGDKAEYTGETTREGLHVLRLLEGASKGKLAYTSESPEGVNPNVERFHKEWRQQQDEFARLHEPAKAPETKTEIHTSDYQKRHPKLDAKIQEILEREESRGNPAFAAADAVYTPNRYYLIDEDGSVRHEEERSRSGFDRAVERNYDSAKQGNVLGSNPKMREVAEQIATKKAEEEAKANAVAAEKQRRDAEEGARLSAEILRGQQFYKQVDADVAKMKGKRREIDLPQGKRTILDYGEFGVHNEPKTGIKSRDEQGRWIVTHLKSSAAAGRFGTKQDALRFVSRLKNETTGWDFSDVKKMPKSLGQQGGRILREVDSGMAPPENPAPTASEAAPAKPARKPRVKGSVGKLPNETKGGTTLGGGLGALQGMGKLFRRDTTPPKGAELDAWADQLSRRIHDSMDDATVGTLDDVVNRAMSAASAGDKAAWNKYRRQAEAILQAQPERDIKKRDYFTSPLSNLNHKGTYERLAGETGKEVSELIRNAQIELDKGGDRAEVFKRLRRDSRVYEAALRDNNLPGLAQYLRRHVDYITQGSTPWSGTANTLRGLQYNLKLRFNPRSTAVNLLQPFQTLWPHMSTAEYASVTRDAMRSETKARLDKVFGDDSALAMEGADPKRKWDLFGKASAFNRRVGYLAGERMADRLGLTGEAKDRMARDWAKKVEFDSGRYDAPPIFRGDAASLLLQFKGFQVKNWERIIADVKNEAPGSITGRKARIGKMLLSQVAIGGVRSLKVPNMIAGFLIVGGISKALQKTGMSPDTADKAAETVYYGLPALVGQDFSGSVGLFDEPFGKTAEERVVNFLGGPTISTGVNLAKGAKDFYDAKDTRETTATEKRKRIALKAAKGITPYAKTAHALANLGMGMAGKQPTKTPDLPIGGQGSSMTPAEAIGYGFMGTPVRQTKYYDKEEAWDWEKNLLGEPTGKRRTGRRPASRPLLPPPQARKPKGFGDL